MAFRLPPAQSLTPAVRALLKAAAKAVVQQPRAISVRQAAVTRATPCGTKTAAQTPPTGQNYLDVPAQVTKAADSSLMQDLHLPTHIQAATEALLTQKAAAILGRSAIRAPGPVHPR